MHIALITDGIHPYVIGGMQRHSFYLAKYFAAAGHRVDLYHTNASKLAIERLEVFTEEEKKNIRSFVVPFPSFGDTPGHYIRESYEYALRIWKIYKEQSRPDFVYVKGFAGWELLNQKKQGVSLPPVGLNFHGYEMFQPAPSWKEWMKYALLLRAPVRFNVKHADVLFSYGGKITPIIESLGVARKKIVEIPTGVGNDWLIQQVNPSASVRKFVFVGRYERRKGLPELTQVLKTFSAVTAFEFHFVGDIPKTKYWNDKRAVYHGKISDSDQLKTILHGAEILVCPSLSEGMPNVILEAMASGLAVVATDVGAVNVVVNAETGWLLAPGNKTALKQTLKNIIDGSADAVLQKRKAAHQLVKSSFTWDIIAKKTCAAIEQLVSTDL
jgi:glycosyltransferase involved in cell wall biosynthesis